MAACGGEDLVLPRDGAAAAVEVVDGDEQTGSVGQPLSEPVVVEVRDAAGAPVEGATVQFAFTSAGDGAQVAPEATETDTLGRAEAHVVLGSKIGLQTGEVRVLRQGADPLRDTFSAVGFAEDNHAPVASFGWDCDGLVCRFSDTSTDDDGDVTGWSWRFGDGGTSTEREPTHRYDQPGSYTVSLTVTDDGGARDEAAEQVTAAGASPPPSSNAPPQADFELDCDNLRCTFTDRSDDPDGQVVRRQWSFGDGASSSERNPSHTYTAPGRYDVRLVATDNDGADDDVTRTAEPSTPLPPPPPPQNAPPRAEFDLQCQELRCVFVDRSSDSDGTIVGWQWSFGDGATSSERSPAHTYAAAGRFDVRLVVTDDDGAEDDRTRTAGPESPAPPPPNDPPSAEFEVECQELRCVFIDRSADQDGSVVGWHWSFGDGASSSERNPSHSYQVPGRYDVLLVVTDENGAADSKTHSAEPKAPAANKPPRAEFEVHCDHLTCSFEDKSSDEDGVIVSRQWSFGDGSTSGEQNPTHSYAEPGKHEVQLTVTDDDGASVTKSHRADVKE
jgi:PKD repeat protein